jgi:hypothetical protein
MPAEASTPTIGNREPAALGSLLQGSDGGAGSATKIKNGECRTCERVLR